MYFISILKWKFTKQALKKNSIIYPVMSWTKVKRKS